MREEEEGERSSYGDNTNVLILFFISLNWEINFLNYMLTWMLNKKILILFLTAMSAFTMLTVHSVCHVGYFR